MVLPDTASRCAHFGHTLAVLGEKAYIIGGEIIGSEGAKTEADTQLYELTPWGAAGDSGSSPHNLSSYPLSERLPTLSGGVLFPNQNTSALIYLPGKPSTAEAPPGSPARHIPRLPYHNRLWTLAPPNWSVNEYEYPPPPSLNVSYAYSASAVDEGRRIGYIFGGFLLESGWNENGVMVGPRSEVSEQYKHSPASAVLLTVDLSAPERGAIEAKVDGDAPVVGGDGKLQGELQMVFAEGYGEKGVLIVLSATGFGERVAMIHDLATNKWHKQTYTPIPTFTNSSILDCAIAVAAPDRSSLNIYTYVHNPDTSNPGWNTTSMHILTLPSFEWINVPPQPRSMSDGSPIPGGGKCFKVPGEPRQMGVFGGGGGGGRRGEQGCLPKGELVRVFDLTKLEWINSKPKTKGEEYEVPEPVYKAIGGDSSGHATRTEPAGGFTEPTLAAIFASQRTPSTSGSFSAVPTENSTLGYPRQHSTLPPANLGWILLAIFGGIVLMTAAWVAFRHRDELKGGDVKEKLTDDMEMNIVVQPKGAEESVPLASAGANNGQAQAARTP